MKKSGNAHLASKNKSGLVAGPLLAYSQQYHTFEPYSASYEPFSTVYTHVDEKWILGFSSHVFLIL